MTYVPEPLRTLIEDLLPLPEIETQLVGSPFMV